MTSWRLRRAGISHVTGMHDGVNAFLSVRQPYIVDAACPPFVENEMDHELLRQHVQLATVRVGQGNEAEPFWQDKERGQVTMPFLSFFC